MLIISCGNKPYKSSESSDGVTSISEEPITSSNIEESSTQSSLSSEELSSSPSKEHCENDLHGYVHYVPVEGGHKKQCDECEEFLSEKEEHVYFTSNIKYCPACGYYDEEMSPYTLSDSFNVTVRTTDGDVQRRILKNIYTSSNGEYFTLSSPSNAHSSYADFSVEDAKFYYDDQIDDGTKLFMLKETSDREKIGTCKTIYTYTLYLFDNITSGSFSYTGGHILIGETPISDWLNSHTSINQITYKYLSVQHHADDYRVPVPGTNAVIVEVTCEDCGEFLYQEVIHND
jgi:formylmethanofuran dehydrogenase subunit E